MANDIRVLDCWSDLMTSDYVQLRHGNLYIRGSKFTEYAGNSFSPDAARRIARYIRELADEADGRNQVQDAPTAVAGHRVSAFFDALVDEGFGPEVTRQLTAAATPVIVQQTYYDTEARA